VKIEYYLSGACHGRSSGAATNLGMKRTSLRYKIQNLGITRRVSDHPADDTGGTIWRVAYTGNDGARKEAARRP